MRKLSTLLTISLFAAGLVFFAQSCKKDPCEGVTCEYGGTPMAQDDECLCPCDDVVCENGEPVGSGESCSCDCETGYEGEECETEMRAKFIASYSVSDDCVSSNYDASIDKSSAAVDKIIIKNFGLYECNGEIPDLIATVNGNDLTIEEQSFCTGVAQFTVKGSGSINESEVTVSISYSGDKPESDGGGTYSCSVTMNKK